MRWEDYRRSDNVEDLCGDDGDYGQGGSGGPGGFPGGRGGLGIGGLIVVGLIAWATGINPALLIGGLEMLQGGGAPQYQEQRRPPPPASTGQPADKQGQFAATVLAQTEDVWAAIFREKSRAYPPPRLVLYTRVTQSACSSTRTESALASPCDTPCLACCTRGSTPRTFCTWWPTSWAMT